MVRMLPEPKRGFARVEVRYGLGKGNANVQDLYNHAEKMQYSILSSYLFICVLAAEI